MKNKFILGLLAFAVFAVVSCGDDDEVTPPKEPSAIEGTWKLLNDAGALAVGPADGSGAWWSSDAGVPAQRACGFDDTYEFTADGDFIIAMGGNTWLEEWQSGVAEACGTPVAPFVGGTYTYTFDETAGTLKVNGTGAFVGLPKATNAGEISTGAAIPTSVTYKVHSVTATSLELRINTGPNGGGDEVHWTFKLTKV